MRYFIVLFIALFILGCSNDDNPNQSNAPMEIKVKLVKKSIAVHNEEVEYRTYIKTYEYNDKNQYTSIKNYDGLNVLRREEVFEYDNKNRLTTRKILKEYLGLESSYEYEYDLDTIREFYYSNSGLEEYSFEYPIDNGSVKQTEVYRKTRESNDSIVYLGYTQQSYDECNRITRSESFSPNDLPGNYAIYTYTNQNGSYIEERFDSNHNLRHRNTAVRNEKIYQYNISDDPQCFTRGFIFYEHWVPR